MIDADHHLSENQKAVAGGSFLHCQNLLRGVIFRLAKSRVRDGDVIVSTVRTYLRAIAPINDPDENLIVSTGFAVIRPKGEVNSNFAAYALRAPYFVEAVVARSVGVSYPAVNASEIGGLSIAIPQDSEQKAIAAFLGRETERINALMEKKQRQIELLQEKRTALISYAVTKGLDPSVPMKDSGIDWLGMIPAHWSKAPVYARYHVKLGKMLDAKRITGNSLAPYVRNVDVQWDQISVLDLNEMDFSDDDKDRYRLEYGDLLVCEGGEIGRTAIWRGELEECYYQKAIHRLRPKNNSDNSRYFYYIMFAAAKSGHFIATGNPNTIDHLTAEKLRTHRFPFPPRDEQDNIVTFLEKETAHTDALIAKIQESLDRLKEYRTALDFGGGDGPDRRAGGSGIMEKGQLQNLVRQLIALPKETEWVEFKHNNADPGEIGEYISALSNSATLHGKQCAYVLWGVDDTTPASWSGPRSAPEKPKSATRNWKSGF